MIYAKMARATALKYIFSWKNKRFYPNLMILQLKFGFFIQISQNYKFGLLW